MGEAVMQSQAAPSGEQWTLSSGEHEAVVVEVGGGLRAYRAGGVQVLDGFGVDEVCPGSAGQVLIPWPNRIRDGRYTFQGTAYQLTITEPPRHNAIHGLVNWSRWHVVRSAADTLTIEYDLPAQPGYPWTLAVRTTWSLGERGLRADHTATNVSATACPFGFSVHPYVLVPGVPVNDLLMHVPARNRLLLDGRMLPIGAARVAGGEFDFTEPRRLGEQILDVAFGDVVHDADGGSAVTLSTSDGRGVRVWADHNFGWWQIFTADTLGGERYRRGVAVEPMTCPPDAFRSGRDLIVLEPGQTWQGTWGLSPIRG
jgi:aldose 1-epimerase